MAFHLVLTLSAPLVTCTLALLWAGYVDPTVAARDVPEPRDLRTW